MRIEQIGIDDIVEAHIKGRTIVGRVTEIKDGTVHFRPICPNAGWWHAKPREIVTHWRKAGRRGGGRREDQSDEPKPIDEQLSLEDASE